MYHSLTLKNNHLPSKRKRIATLIVDQRNIPGLSRSMLFPFAYTCTNLAYMHPRTGIFHRHTQRHIVPYTERKCNLYQYHTCLDVLPHKFQTVVQDCGADLVDHTNTKLFKNDQYFLAFKSIYLSVKSYNCESWEYAMTIIIFSSHEGKHDIFRALDNIFCVKFVVSKCRCVLSQV